MLIKYLFIIILFISPLGVFSQEDDENSLGNVLLRYFSTSKSKNQPLLDIHYGPENLTLDAINLNFEDNFTLQVDYGFYRYDNDLSKDGILYYSAEKAFFANSSSRLKISEVNESNQTTDIYKYGFSYMNGYGYGSVDGQKALFSHESGFIWSQIDIENFDGNENPGDFLSAFDQNHNFGTFYNSGFRYSLSNTINLSLKYQHQLVYADFGGWNWIGGWMAENIMQRWIDLFHPYLSKSFGRFYPVIYHAYKTGVSFLLYELRNRESNWPFRGSEVMNMQSFRIGFSFVF